MKTTIASLLTAALLSVTVIPAAQAEEKPALTPTDAAIEKFIMEHPDVLMKSLKQYKKRDKMTPEAAVLLKSDTGSPSIGNPNGDITLIEFFDYHCGYCKRFYPVLSQLVDQDKNLKVIFKELPILSEDSEVAARASIAVYTIDPSKYFGYHSALMKMQGKFEIEKLTDMARQAGIPENQFMSAYKSEKVTEELNRTKSLAEELEVSGTPMIIVGKQMIPGAIDFESLRSKIAAERAKTPEKS